MRQRRLLVITLVLGSLGFYLVGTAQERITPWPPPPVRVTDDVPRSKPYKSKYIQVEPTSEIQRVSASQSPSQAISPPLPLPLPAPTPKVQLAPPPPISADATSDNANMTDVFTPPLPSFPALPEPAAPPALSAEAKAPTALAPEIIPSPMPPSATETKPSIQLPVVDLTPSASKVEVQSALPPIATPTPANQAIPQPEATPAPMPMLPFQPPAPASRTPVSSSPEASMAPSPDPTAGQLPPPSLPPPPAPPATTSPVIQIPLPNLAPTPPSLPPATATDPPMNSPVVQVPLPNLAPAPAPVEQTPPMPARELKTPTPMPPVIQIPTPLADQTPTRPSAEIKLSPIEPAPAPAPIIQAPVASSPSAPMSQSAPLTTAPAAEKPAAFTLVRPKSPTTNVEVEIPKIEIVMPTPSIKLERPAPKTEPVRPSTKLEPEKSPTTPHTVKTIDPLGKAELTRVLVGRQGPTSLRSGDIANVEFRIVNTNSEAMPGVLVEYALPVGTTLRSMSPKGQVIDGRFLRWNLPTLRDEILLSVVLQSATKVDEVGMPRLSSAHAITPVNLPQEKIAPTDLKSANLAEVPLNGKPATIQIKGPLKAAAGRPIALEIIYASISDQPLTDVVLEGVMSEGLYHPKGKQIALPPMTLAPGATKTIKLTLSALQPGKQTLEMSLKSPTFGVIAAQWNVEIETGALLISAPTTRVALGQNGEYRIEVTNQTAQVLKPVSVAGALPEGIEFQVASNRGIYQPNNGTVHWVLDQLTPGQTQILAIKIHAHKAGQFPCEFSAQADSVGVSQAKGGIVVEGFTDLKVLVVEQDNPLELGRDTAYEIRIRNHGTTAATGVKVQAVFSDGLSPKQGANVSKHTAEGKTVTFETLPRLAGGAQHIVRINATAASLGDQRVRVAVSSEQMPSPILREQQTLVVPR